ncbi:MAG: Gmad2 immunoglobulin-like domain-containing protein [Tangfeifania sp.]
MKRMCMFDSKIVLILFFGLLISCQSANKNGQDSEKEKQTEEDVKSGSPDAPDNMEEFQSDESHFLMRLPKDWEFEKSSRGGNFPIINAFPSDEKETIELPATVHADPEISYIGIFPKGYGTELPFSKTRKMSAADPTLSFEINQTKTTVFLLENDQVWGYFIVPASPPADWSDNGFIFAQVAAENIEIKCFDEDTDEELEMSECNPMTGDEIKRFGNIPEENQETLTAILQSFQFKNFSAGTDENVSSEKGIRIEKPTAGSTVSFPLEITGEARGNWFFEAEFTVRLVQNGTELAIAIVKAQDDWMTMDYVPFSATMNFDAEGRGGDASLVFKNNNASGKPELDKTFKLPVKIEK